LFALRKNPTTGRSTTPARGRIHRGWAYVALLAGLFVLIQPASAAFAFASPATVDLGAAGNFTVLAATTVTNTGATVISADAGLDGNLGVSPGTAVTGFPPGVVTAPGTIHSADTATADAKTAADAAYTDAAARTPDQTFAPIHDLGGATFTAGVYNDPSSFGITGTVTLDAEGNPDAVFIFQAGSTLVTAVSSHVVLINGAQAANVFWSVGSSATLGVNSTFAGTVLAQTAITVNTGVDVQGRVLAGTAAVTLDTDTINAPVAAPSSGVPQAPLFGQVGWTVALIAFLGGGGVLVFRRRRQPAPIQQPVQAR
jgi:hypothetical protein